jgi:hypothetical protein
MEVNLATEGSLKLKRGVQQDITAFLGHFNTSDHIKFSEFRSKWAEMDLGLLTVVVETETIISCLIQVGLFGPTRPFRDHQLLVFFLLALHKTCRRTLKVSADRIQFLLGVRMRAAMLGESETVEALEFLFKNDTFVILADETKILITDQVNSNHSAVSVDQLHDRLKRIQSFLSSHPLFDHKLSRTTFTRLNGLFEKYYDAKRKSMMMHAESEQDFGTVMAGILKIVDGYEKLLARYSTVNFNTNNTPTASRSIRSRLTQQSLTPVMLSANNNVTISAELFSRSQSVPAIKARRQSALREVDIDEFIESSTCGTSNMPNINFY